MGAALSGTAETAKYLAFQRTHLQPQLALTARRWLGKRFVDGFALEYLIKPDAILAAYSDEIAAEHRQIAPHLPAHARHIIDIGCGLGGIDVLLYRQFSLDLPRLYLFDRTQVDKSIHYGHRKVASFYNDLSVTQRFLTRNGVPKENLVVVEAAAGRIREQNAAFDIIISLLSWGFHYDLDTYLDEALAALAPGGVIIIDLRKDSSSAEQLGHRPNLKTTVIADHEKHQRMKISVG